VCVVAIAFHTHSDFPLIVAANRDERFNRPSRPAGFWAEEPQVLGGRDLVAGGSWLAVSRQGRFAVVTNGGGAALPGKRSRGELVGRYVAGHDTPAAFLASVAASRSLYAPFYLVAGDIRELHHLDGASGTMERLGSGTHVVLNHPLHQPSRKADRVREQVQAILGGDPAPERLLALLADETRYPEEATVITGAPPEIAEAVTAVRVRAKEYGTRCSTVLMVRGDGEVTFVERPFDEDGAAAPDRTFRFTLLDR